MWVGSHPLGAQDSVSMGDPQSRGAEDERLPQLLGSAFPKAAARACPPHAATPGHPALSCDARSVPGLGPAWLHPRLICTLLTADWLRHEGPRAATRSSGLASAAPARATGFGALRALLPDHRAEALSSVSLSRGETTRLLERRWKAQGLAATPRSCEQPRRVQWQGL